MADKILQTIIINRNDNLFSNGESTGWDNSTRTLMAGEIALAKITTQQPDGHGGIIEVPAYLMKVGVGDKSFKDSAWLYAKASDVYSWAKKESLEYADLPESLKKTIEELKAASGDTESITEQISSALEVALGELDSIQTGDGSFVTAVTQTDGKVSVTYGKVGVSDIDGLQSALDGKASTDSLTIEEDARKSLGVRVDRVEEDVYTLTSRVNEIGEATTDIDGRIDDKITNLNLPNTYEPIGAEGRAKAYVDGLFSDANVSQYTTEQEVKTIIDEVIADASDDAVSGLSGLTTMVVECSQEIDNKADNSELERVDATLAEVKATVDNFFADDAAINDTIDTLKEIAEYITNDKEGAADITSRVGVLESKVDVAKVSTAIGQETSRATGAENALSVRIKSLEDNDAGYATASEVETAKQGAISSAAADAKSKADKALSDANSKAAELDSELKEDIEATISEAVENLEKEDTRLATLIDSNKKLIQEEQSSRASGDDVLDDKIITLNNTVNTNKRLYDSYVVANDARVKAIEDADDAQDALLTAIQVELNKKINTSDANTSHLTLESKITSEANSRASADTTLGGRIDVLSQTHSTDKQTLTNEDVRLAGLISDNATAIGQESNRATGVENGLSNRLGTAEGKITSIENQIRSLSSATILEGAGAIADRPLTGKVAGAIYIATDTHKEYVWDGSSWVELGDTSMELQEINTIKASLETERGARESSDTTLQNNINALSNTVNANNTAFENYRSSNNTKIQALEDKDSSQDSAIEGIRSDVDKKATTDALNQVKTDLQSSISSESTVRLGADEALGGRIDVSNERIEALEIAVGDSTSGITKQVNTHQELIGTNATAISTEKQRAQGAEGALSSRVTELESALSIANGQIGTLETAVENFSKGNLVKITSMDEITDASKIYLLASDDGTYYLEYICVDGEPELIGTTVVELENYVSKDYLQNNVKFYRHNITLKYSHSNSTFASSGTDGRFVATFVLENDDPDSYSFVHNNGGTSKAVMTVDDAWQYLRLYYAMQLSTLKSNSYPRPSSGTLLTLDSNLKVEYGIIETIRTLYTDPTDADWTRYIRVTGMKCASGNYSDQKVSIPCGHPLFDSDGNEIKWTNKSDFYNGEFQAIPSSGTGRYKSYFCQHRLTCEDYVEEVKFKLD